MALSPWLQTPELQTDDRAPLNFRTFQSMSGATPSYESPMERHILPSAPSNYISNGGPENRVVHRDHEKRTSRLEIEKRCKDRKADSLQQIKNELKERGFNVEGTASTQANLLFRAADAMRQDREQIAELQREIEELRQRLAVFTSMLNRNQIPGQPAVWNEFHGA
ncbi:hypothetical protein SISNIDRAFT_489721 [Sistotremastrum niveocremeum HHB9708]|uniref:Uncharacterized protein n=2 Tax=Sistotremastraceae TaxID=3402574 RepID=A0A164PML6_9AGAM|nr:hypothetical protein SISNIDRAFT_489721 [Sistotremastrum niveocremeum HHB9708]KZT34431.1 hypothetical protein SISSUDRAFT_1065305 [Sistotremastrum suecicum HHB10207 ss-3]